MAVVYWLYDETCSWPQTEGYVGISVNLPNRIRGHRHVRGYTFQCSPLFEGTRRECLMVEYELRPRDGIGWNVARGGSAPSEDVLRRSKAVRALLPPPMQGKKHSAETRARMREAALKRMAEGRGHTLNGFSGPHSDETKAKLRAARLLQPDPRLGHKHTPESIEKIRRSRRRS